MRSRTTYPRMVEVLSPAVVGVAEVSHITVTKHEVEMAAMRAMFGGGDRFARTEPGQYARLTVRGELMMTDTDMERITNEDFVRRAEGDVLVAGLGLGMILHPVLAKPSVRTITVIEKYADVLAVVGPTVTDPRVTVAVADIFDWKPARGTKYDTIYFDIWPTLSPDNLPEMARLHRKFARYLNKANPNNWMASWRRDYCRLLAQRYG